MASEDEAALLEDMADAWGIIANADWPKQTEEWQAAARRWRDEVFHPALDRARAGSQRADGDTVEIITKRWNGDAFAGPGDPSTATIYQRVFVNGTELVGAVRSRVLTGADFNYVLLRVCPGHLIVRDVDHDEFVSYQPEPTP